MPMSVGHVLPHALDAVEQVAAALRIGQPDQAHADLDLHRIDGQVVFDRAPRAAAARPARCALRLRRCDSRLATSITRQAQASGAEHQQRSARQVGGDQHAQKAAGHGQRLRPREELRAGTAGAGWSSACCA